MAQNVFGIPIDKAYLESMPDYADADEVTRRDLAKVALEHKTSGGKDKAALQFVENLKAQWGSGAGHRISTRCLLYNATGTALDFVHNHDYSGHIGAVHYPLRLENGQWGAFLHVKTTLAPRGSCAAVVYRGAGEDGVARDWMVSWSNPWLRVGQDNTVYAEVREQDYFPKHWPDVEGPTEAAGMTRDTPMGGCRIIASTGSDTTALVEAVFTLGGI